MLIEKTNLTPELVREELAELTSAYRARKRALTALLRVLETEPLQILAEESEPNEVK